jgi:uncharacterized protein
VRRFQVKNATRSSLLATEAGAADSFMQRFKGLMGVPELPMGQGLHIVPCTSIHTFFMKIPIDALFLDENRVVVEVYHALKPWRMSRFHPQAHSVLELPAGTALSSGTQAGDRLVFELHAEP